MPNPLEIREKLIGIAEPVCNSAGYELVDLRFVREGSWVARIFIDRLAGDDRLAASEKAGMAPGADIGIADCERVSRELSAVFDVEDPVIQAYRLEVSSPGVERPLRTLAHFQQVIGQSAKIAMLTTSSGVNGRRKFSGTVIAVEVDNASGDTSAKTTGTSTIVKIDVDGDIFELPIDDIATATLIPDWDQVMARRQ